MLSADKAHAEIRLPPILDLKAAAPLRDEFLAARGMPVTVDASDVQRVGGLCLQVLISASQTWAADDQILTVEHASADFLDGIALFDAAFLAAPTEHVSGA